MQGWEPKSVLIPPIALSLKAGVRHFSGASDWYFQSRKKLVCEDVKSSHLRTHGTRVEVRFTEKAKVPYSSSEDLIALVRRHYLPLLDQRFLDLYDTIGCYSKKLRFILNGELVKPSTVVPDFPGRP